MALAGNPELLLLDEPTTGLDVTTQAHVLELLKDIAKDTGTSMVYVSHDLGAIAQVCDRVIVMYAGEIVLRRTSKKNFKRTYSSLYIWIIKINSKTFFSRSSRLNAR